MRIRAGLSSTINTQGLPFSRLGASTNDATVNLHVQFTHFHRFFAFKNDPAPGGKTLVFSVCLLAFYGSEFGATTGSNLNENQQLGHTGRHQGTFYHRCRFGFATGKGATTGTPGDRDEADFPGPQRVNH